MESKFIEIRDAGTFIPALAIWINQNDGYLARRAGFGSKHCVYLIMLATERCAYDPYSWQTSDARTMPVAHEWIEKNWDDVTDGMVVDVEFILGLRDAPKRSERDTTDIRG